MFLKRPLVNPTRIPIKRRQGVRWLVELPERAKPTTAQRRDRSMNIKTAQAARHVLAAETLANASHSASLAESTKRDTSSCFSALFPVVSSTGAG
jgi:hypothetical protein